MTISFRQPVRVAILAVLFLPLHPRAHAMTASSHGQAPDSHAEILAPPPVRSFGAVHVADPTVLNLPAVPLDVVVDVATVEREHPGAAAWATVTADLCRKWYPVICDTLGANDPPNRVTLVVVPKLGPSVGAHAEGSRITVSVESIVRNPADYGSMIHELVHIAQGYTYGLFRNRGVGWLVEGIADYVRFYRYEADPRFGGIRAGQSHYTDSYRSTACFLDYLVRTYDANFVKKLHHTLCEGKMSNAAFNQMLADDPDVSISRRKGADALYQDFIEEWTKLHAASATNGR